MKKLVVLLLASLFVVNVASAVVDPDTNSMGFYMDANADLYEFATAPYVIVPVNVILTNPDFEALFGYEFGYQIVGNHMVSGTALRGTGPIDVGGGPGNHIVGLAAPMATTPATILATLSIFVLDANPISFTLFGATPNSVVGSNTPAVLLAGDVILKTGVSAWDEAAGAPGICAYINGSGVVATK
jgi:hypothetical protein